MTTNKKQDLQEQWERGVEHATESKRATSELDQEALNDAAGLDLQSGVKGGLWGVTHTCSCGHTCGSAVC